MIGKRFPRLMLSAVALGVVAAVIMLSLFFGQYRWLAKQIVVTSTEQHYAFLQGSFERRARSQIHAVADALPVGDATGDAGVVSLALDRALNANDGLTGIRFTSSGGQSWESGSLPAVGACRRQPGRLTDSSFSIRSSRTTKTSAIWVVRFILTT